MIAFLANDSPTAIQLLGMPAQRVSSAVVQRWFASPATPDSSLPDSHPTDQETRSDRFCPPSAGVTEQGRFKIELGCLPRSAYFPL
jgi:hypothetical protein